MLLLTDTGAHFGLYSRRNGMNKRKIWILVISVAFAAGVVLLFRIVTVTTLATEGSEAASAQSTAEEASQASNQEALVSGDSDQASAAEALIGQTLTRSQIEESLGACSKFEMSANGCERGVYAGRFYYDGYTIFSRTYDKGETFYIVSINAN